MVLLLPREQGEAEIMYLVSGTRMEELWFQETSSGEKGKELGQIFSFFLSFFSVVLSK